MSNVPILKPQEVVRILENVGFVEVRHKGSHKKIGGSREKGSRIIEADVS